MIHNRNPWKLGKRGWKATLNQHNNRKLRLLVSRDYNIVHERIGAGTVKQFNGLQITLSSNSDFWNSSRLRRYDTIVSYWHWWSRRENRTEKEFKCPKEERYGLDVNIISADFPPSLRVSRHLSTAQQWNLSTLDKRFVSIFEGSLKVIQLLSKDDQYGEQIRTQQLESQYLE